MKIVILAKTELAQSVVRDTVRMKDLNFAQRAMFRVLFRVVVDDLPEKLVIESKKSEVDNVLPVQMKETITKGFLAHGCQPGDFSVEVVLS